MCGGLHVLDVLALQDQMHNAHKDSEGIPEYISTLEDGRDTAERAGAPISNNMLFIIATKAMLTTEQYPRANEDWEDLDQVFSFASISSQSSFSRGYCSVVSIAFEAIMTTMFSEIGAPAR